MRTGCPGLQEYTLSSRSVPPVTKYLPPELNSEHKVWSPIRFFSMNFRGVVLRSTQRDMNDTTNPSVYSVQCKLMSVSPVSAWVRKPLPEAEKSIFASRGQVSKWYNNYNYSTYNYYVPAHTDTLRWVTERTVRRSPDSDGQSEQPQGRTSVHTTHAQTCPDYQKQSSYYHN